MPKGDKFIELTAYLEKCGMDDTCRGDIATMLFLQTETVQMKAPWITLLFIWPSIWQAGGCIGGLHFFCRRIIKFILQ